jgi:hypothetical protein
MRALRDPRLTLDDVLARGLHLDVAWQEVDALEADVARDGFDSARLTAACVMATGEDPGRPQDDPITARARALEVLDAPGQERPACAAAPA